MKRKAVNSNVFGGYLNDRPALRYGLTFLAVGLAALATSLSPVMTRHAPFLLFFVAIVQCGFWFGVKSCILAASLSFAAVNALVLKTIWQSAPQNALMLNLGFCWVAVLLISVFRRYRRLTQTLLENRQDSDLAQSIGKTGSWRLDVQKNVLSWSDQNHRIFGIPQGIPLTYESFLDAVHPDDRAYVDSTWQAALTGEPYDIEHRIVVEGIVKWVRETAVLEFDKNGKLLGGFGTTSDISERKQAEADLQERIERYELVLEGAQDALWDWDVRHKRVHRSRRWRTLRGLSEPETGDAEKEWSERIHAEDKGRVLAAIKAHLEGKTPVFCEEYRVRCNDHSWKWVLDRGIAQLDKEGRVVRMAGSETDITARKIAETTLQERENELKLIMDATPALISYLDCNLRYKRLNKTYRDWFGFPVEDIVGKEVRDIIGRDAWKIVRPFLERALAGEPVCFDYRIPYGAGKPRWVHCNYMPNVDSDGRVRGIVVHVVDVDQRIKAEEEISLLNKNLQRRIDEMQVIFETVPVGLVIADDATGYRIHGNGLSSEMLGLPPGSELSKAGSWPTPYKVMFEGRELAINQLPMQRAVRGEAVNNRILDIYRSDGRIVTLLSTAVPLFNEDGTIRGAVGAFQDITELKKTEAALQQSEERIRAAAEKHLEQLQAHQAELQAQNRQLQKTSAALATSTEHYRDLYDCAPLAYLTLNSQGLIEEINLTAAVLLGDKRERLMHCLFTDFVTDDHQALWRRYFYGDKQYRIELTLRNREGRKIYVQLESQKNKTTAKRPQIRISLTDISERTLASNALHESEERMRLATETTGVGIWEWNVSTGQIRWDAQMFRIYGIQPTEDGCIRYETWSSSLIPDDLSKQEQIFQDTIRRRGRNTGKFRIRRVSDKAVRHIQAVETVRLNDVGQVEWMLGTNLDVTERTQTEHALKESEARLALGVQVAKLAVAEVDYTTWEIHLSAEAARLFGLGETEMKLPRWAVQRNFRFDQRERLMKFINEAASPLDADQSGRDHRVEWPDGRLLWLRVRSRIFSSGNGEMNRVTLAIHDITAEKLASEAMLASENFVRNVLNSLPEHVVVLDKAGTILAVNEPWERFAIENDGCLRQVVMGINYLDVCRRSLKTGDGNAKKALDGLEALLAGAQDEFVMEYPCPVNDRVLWFLMHAKRVEHQSIAAIITHKDITEHRRTEAALRESEVRLALIVEEVNAGYWDWDLTTNTIYFSPEWKRQIGFEPHEFDDRQEEWENRLHPDDRNLVIEETKRAIEGLLSSFELQYRLRHKNGAYRWIHSRGALLRDPQAKPVRILGINLDITGYIKNQELNERRDEIEKSFRLYVASQTAAAIAHELNQPLTAISYYAYVAQELLNSGNQQPLKLAQVLEKCGQQAQRAGEVIKQLLALLHKGESLTESLDINQPILFALELVKANSQYNFAKIELNLADGLPKVSANAMQIQKVLINLLNNAFEATSASARSDGMIAVATQRFDKLASMVQVTVTDCGIGVPDAEMLNKLFQPFYTTKSNGLGMGLAISRALIEAHGGKMWAEQNPVGGLSVHFTLPFVL